MCILLVYSINSKPHPPAIEGTMNKHKLALAAALMMATYPMVSFAAPAPLSYTKPDGRSAAVQMAVAPNADGSLPVASYVGADGKNHAPIVQANICSLSGNVPQLCVIAGEFPAFVYDKSGTVKTATALPNSDPLVSGEVWSNGGVVMLSTGQAATPTITGDLTLDGNFLLDSGKAITFHGPAGTTATSAYMYGNSYGGISVVGSFNMTNADAASSLTAPDTTLTDMSRRVLNTESAYARFAAINGVVTGTGVAYACFNAAGQVIRQTTACGN